MTLSAYCGEPFFFWAPYPSEEGPGDTEETRGNHQGDTETETPGRRRQTPCRGQDAFPHTCLGVGGQEQGQVSRLYT